MFASVVYLQILSLLLKLFTCEDKNLTVNFILSDETKASSIIGNIIQQTNDFPINLLKSGQYFINIMGRDKFSLGEYFVVRPNGELLTSQHIDRDAICKRMQCCKDLVCQLKFHVYFLPINDGPQKKVAVQVEIDIFDLNDSTPTFPNQTMVISVEENFQEYRMNGPWRERIPSARDDDSSDNSVMKYELVGDSISKKIFQLNQNNPEELYLEFVKHSILDYENPLMQSFLMKVIARDGGNPPKEGFILLEIKVLNLDDNRPEFSPDIEKRIDLKEEFLPAKPLLQLSGTDKDFGEHGQVFFSLQHSSLPSVAKHFYLDKITGQLSLLEPLDYETLTTKSFNLTFVISSGVNNSLTDSINIQINVIDINDHLPIIENSAIIHLREDTTPMHIIDQINITDLDSVSEGKITCSLDDDFDRTFDLRYLSSANLVTTFEIILLKKVDFESVNRMNLLLKCTDMAIEMKMVDFKIPIDVIDVNDNPPMFRDFVNDTLKELRINEDHPIGHRVIDFNMVDVDLRQNTKFNFYIESSIREEDLPFKIDRYKGILYLSKKLDYENVREYNLTVIVHDNEPPEMYYAVKLDLNIKVINVNDNPPELSTPLGTIFLSEAEEEVPRSILHLNFFDRDLNDTVSVTFDPNYANAHEKMIHDHFKIKEDGNIILLKNIDRELYPQIQLKVIGVDSGRPQRTTSVDIDVIIEDVNDCVPILEHPANKTIIEYLVNTNDHSDKFITKLITRDDDLGGNSRITMSLLSKGNGSAYFQVKTNKDTYFLSSMDGANIREDAVYAIHLYLTDHGNPRLSSESIFYIRSMLNKSQSVWLSDQEYHGNGLSNIKSQEGQDPVVKRNFTRGVVMQALIGGLVMIFSAAFLSILVAIFIWSKDRKTRDRNGPSNPGKFRKIDPDRQMATPMKFMQDSIDCPTPSTCEQVSFLSSSQRQGYYTEPSANENILLNQLMPDEYIDTGQPVILIASNDIFMSSSMNSNYPTLKTDYVISTEGNQQYYQYN